MSEEQYSNQLALEIPKKGYIPMPDAMVESYNLRPGMRSPFTRYKIVPRKPEYEVKRCSNCSADLLAMPEVSHCPLCGSGFQETVSCANCHAAHDISHKICSDCGLTICILCLAGANGIPRALPSECPQCGSGAFQISEQTSSAPSP